MFCVKHCHRHVISTIFSFCVRQTSAFPSIANSSSTNTSATICSIEENAFTTLISRTLLEINQHSPVKQFQLMMSKNRKPTSATARLKQDYLRLNRDPVPYITAEPLPSNILEWHYVVTGPENTPYEGGYYHGKLVFPREFPFKPPSIYMITPSGRFKPNTRLCLSISDFHPDNWNPAWSVSTILTGLLSFMNEKSPTVGSIETSDYQKRLFAYQSLEYNMKNGQFKDLFPGIATTIEAELSNRQLHTPQETNTKPIIQQNSEASNLQCCVVNLLVFAVFACFAFVVKHVMIASASVEDTSLN